MNNSSEALCNNDVAIVASAQSLFAILVMIVICCGIGVFATKDKEKDYNNATH